MPLKVLKMKKKTYKFLSIPRRDIKLIGNDASTLANRSDIKVNIQGHLNIGVFNSLHFSFVYNDIEKLFFMDEEEILKTYQNITHQPLL